MKSSLIALSQTASIFTHSNDDQLKMGYSTPNEVPKAEDSNRESSNRSSKTTENEKGRQNAAGALRNTSQSWNKTQRNTIQQGDFDRTGTYGIGHQRNLRQQDPEELKRRRYARDNYLCYRCMDPNHMEKDCPHKTPPVQSSSGGQKSSSPPKVSPVMKKEGGMNVEGGLRRGFPKNEPQEDQIEKSIFDEERPRHQHREESGGMVLQEVEISKVSEKIETEEVKSTKTERINPLPT